MKSVLGTAGALLVALLAAGACGEGASPSDPDNGPVPTPPAAATITVDSTTRFQEIVGGWAAAAQACHFECPETYSNFADKVAPAAVEKLGLTRVRVEVRSGQENPRDFARDFVENRISFNTWKQNFYSLENDNLDPFVVNPAGFQFTELDLTLERVVFPIRELLAARGEKLYMNLTYVDFGGSSFEHYRDEDEYAEFVLVMFQHLDEKYGIVPDGFEVILEPDNAQGWSPVQVGRALAAAGERLRQYGYNPEFYAPSTASMQGASAFFDELVEVPGVRDYLTVLSYHRYRGVSDQALSDLVERAESAGLRTAMLEHLTSGHENLHEDLTAGNNSSWQRLGLAWPQDAPDGGGDYLVIDPQDFEVRLSAKARFKSQYFRSIRPGARRLLASSTDENLDPVAFVNGDGRFVAVVKADRDAQFTIGGLPAGTYDVGYTTNDTLLWTAGQVTIAAGEPAEVSMPATGVLSLRQR